MTAKHLNDEAPQKHPLDDLFDSPPACGRRNRRTKSPLTELAGDYSSIADVHQNALGFLKPSERLLLKPFFNADGTKVPGAKATSSAEKSAIKRRNEVFELLMERATNEVQFTSIPRIIDNLPISRDQKRVLSQVRFLAGQKLRNCCAKNLYLAVTLELAEGTVSNIISLLLRRGYIVERSGFDGRSRHLILNPAKFPALEEKRQAAHEGHQPMDAAAIADGGCIHSELTLPPFKMEAASIQNGRGRTANCSQLRMAAGLMSDVDLAESGVNLEDNHDNNPDAKAASRQHAGVLMESSAARCGASPQTPPGGKPPGPPAFPQQASASTASTRSSNTSEHSSPANLVKLDDNSGMGGGLAASTKAPSAHPVPSTEVGNQTPDEHAQVTSFLRFVSIICDHFPPAKPQVNKECEKLVWQFFKHRANATALHVANYFLRALYLADQQKHYANGNSFQFGASKASRRDLGYFFRKFENVEREVHDNAIACKNLNMPAASFWNGKLDWLLERLLELSPAAARTEVENVFAHELSRVEENRQNRAMEKEKKRLAQEQRAREENQAYAAKALLKEQQDRARLDPEVARMTPEKAIQVLDVWIRGLDLRTFEGAVSADAKIAFEVLRRIGHEFPHLQMCNVYSGGLRRRLGPFRENTFSRHREDLLRFKALAQNYSSDQSASPVQRNEDHKAAPEAKPAAVPVASANRKL